MEAFESFVALTMEDDGLVVSEAVKFPVNVTVPSREGSQVHGFEVDLVGARADKLVLATVKSFFGSRGVVADHVMGGGSPASAKRLYALLNNATVQTQVVTGAASRYGYAVDHVEMRLYVGKFADKSGKHEARIREWCQAQQVGGGPILVYDVGEVARKARRVAAKKQYRDNAALVAIKVLEAAGELQPYDEPPAL